MQDISSDLRDSSFSPSSSFWWFDITSFRKSFGQYGHYRGAAIGEIAARPVKFAGHETCETCHTDVLDVKSKGKHAHVNCEACHGPLAKHADDPHR